MKGRYTNMKRDFLKDLGLEKEAIDSIMEENGKDIEAAKGDVKSLESKISTLESDNATLKKQVEDRDSQLETLKNSTGDVEAALTGAKAKNNTAVKALLKDLDKAEFAEDGTIKGLAEQIESLQQSDAYLFESKSSKPNVKGAKPGESGNEDGDHGVDTSKMTYSELAAYMAENPDAKI